MSVHKSASSPPVDSDEWLESLRDIIIPNAGVAMAWDKSGVSWNEAKASIKAKLLHREQMAVLRGRLAEIQNWFGSYLKSYENWTDEFDMDFVKERITELEAELKDLEGTE